MSDRERYYSMNAGVEAGKASAVYLKASEGLNHSLMAAALKAKTKALIAQNPKSGLQREDITTRKNRFATGLASDFWL